MAGSRCKIVHNTWGHSVQWRTQKSAGWGDWQTAATSGPACHQEGIWLSWLLLLDWTWCGVWLLDRDTSWICTLLLFSLQVEKQGCHRQRRKKWRAGERWHRYTVNVSIGHVFSFSLQNPVIEVIASLGSEISNLKCSVEPCAFHLQQSLKL